MEINFLPNGHRDIVLQTKKDLDIFMNPTRQKILRLFLLTKEPMTAKALSRELGVSASSAQYHIKLLETLGLLKVHHTAIINGITATYYADGDATVHIGMGEDALTSEREALALQMLQDVWSGFIETTRKWRSLLPSGQWSAHGEVLSGVAHLTPGEWEQLQSLLLEFVRSHEQPREGTTPWEYALLAYDTELLAVDEKQTPSEVEG